jgi:hypothetical protein
MPPPNQQAISQARSKLNSFGGRFPPFDSCDFQRVERLLMARGNMQTEALENSRSNLPLPAQKPPFSYNE